MERMGISLSSKPLKVPAKKFEAGKLLMGMNEVGQRIEFDIECSGRDLDRKA